VEVVPVVGAARRKMMVVVRGKGKEEVVARIGNNK